MILFFFNDTTTTEIYTLSLHDALPIARISTWRWRSTTGFREPPPSSPQISVTSFPSSTSVSTIARSEEHTSELQSHVNIVCRLLLEKKKMLDIQHLP